MPIKPMIMLMKITDLKFFPRRIAILAGRTMMVDTKSAPAAGMVKAMAIPVTMLNKTDMRRTGRPSTKAVSSSKVKMYIGRMNRTVKMRTKMAMAKSAITCPELIVIIEPNKYCSKLTFPLSDLLVTMSAIAKPSDIKIAVEISI